MKRCYLIRHAETAWNREHRIQGQSDRALSPIGFRQAQQVASALASARLVALYTSHLQRSRQTAQTILQGNGHAVQPIVEPDLSEIHLGAWEGLTPDEVEARFEGGYQLWRVRPSEVTIPEAEPLEVFHQRVRRVFTRIFADLQEGETAVVTHGGVIASVLAEALGADYDTVLHGLRLDNAGITALECSGRSPTILWVNDTRHLEGL